METDKKITIAVLSVIAVALIVCAVGTFIPHTTVNVSEGSNDWSGYSYNINEYGGEIHLDNGDTVKVKPNVKEHQYQSSYFYYDQTTINSEQCIIYGYYDVYTGSGTQADPYKLNIYQNGITYIPVEHIQYIKINFNSEQ